MYREKHRAISTGAPGKSFKKSPICGILRKAPYVKRKNACFPQASKHRYSKLYSLGKPDEMLLLSGFYYYELATHPSFAPNFHYAKRHVNIQL